MNDEGEYQCDKCNKEDRDAIVYWNDCVIGDDELTHPNTKDYTALCEDCKYELENKEDNNE